jgi:hypothetical protein
MAELSGLDCFLSEKRVCGPSCMSFTKPRRFADKSELSEQQQHCTLLASIERVGRHLPILASIAHDSFKTYEATEKRRRVQDADRQREASTQGIPPNPFGRKP